MTGDPTAQGAVTPTATAAQRCSCCPRCLSPICPSDPTVRTAQGVVLVAHLQAAPYPYATEHLTSLTSPLSVVGAK